MNELIQDRHRDSTSYEGDVSHELLKPLLEGKAVALAVTDRAIFPRKRVTQPVLFLMPGTMVGYPDIIVASLWGQGCEVINIWEPVRPIEFVRLGVGMRTAKLLSQSLTKLYSEGKHHGNEEISTQ